MKLTDEQRERIVNAMHNTEGSRDLRQNTINMLAAGMRELAKLIHKKADSLPISTELQRATCIRERQCADGLIKAADDLEAK